jgi:ATP-dependent DNA helicase RecQ
VSIFHQEFRYLAVIINYRPQPLAAAPAPKAGERGKSDESWRALIAEADVPLFNALRDWRATRSRREGLPPYVIGTNRQLAAMVLARPTSLAKLGEIEGFGQAKLERYGKEILAILAPAVEPATTPAPPAETGTEAEAAPTQEEPQS